MVYSQVNFKGLQKIGHTGPFRIVIVAGMDGCNKMFGWVIKGLELLKSYTDKVVEVDFIGDGDPSDVIELVDNSEVTYMCNFIGKLDRDTLLRRLCEYDLLVHSSYYTSFGLVILDAMAIGLPVLVSNNRCLWTLFLMDDMGIILTAVIR